LKKRTKKLFATARNLIAYSAPPERGTIRQSFCFFFQKEALSSCQPQAVNRLAIRNDQPTCDE
jgi:hypothetical protein